MFHSNHPRSHRIPYGVQRFHRMQPGVVRYGRFRLPYRRVMYRPRFYPPPPPPVITYSFFDDVLTALAALFSLNKIQPKRQVRPKRGIGRAGLPTSGADLPTISGGGTSGGGGGGGGGGGTSGGCGGCGGD